MSKRAIRGRERIKKQRDSGCPSVSASMERLREFAFHLPFRKEDSELLRTFRENALKSLVY